MWQDSSTGHHPVLVIWKIQNRGLIIIEFIGGYGSGAASGMQVSYVARMNHAHAYALYVCRREGRARKAPRPPEIHAYLDRNHLDYHVSWRPECRGTSHCQPSLHGLGGEAAIARGSADLNTSGAAMSIQYVMASVR